MQPLRIQILGDYLDCQIYRGRLYLWTFDGELKVFNWDKIVESFIKSDLERLSIYLAFSNGSLLYKSDLSLIFKDREFKDLLYSKTRSLEGKEYIITEKGSDKFLFGEQDIPGGLLPIDTELYGNKLYFVNDTGLHVSSAHRTSKKYPVSSRPLMLWDNKIISIKASKGPQMALSGGNSGLFELDLSDNDDDPYFNSSLKEVENGTGIEKIRIFTIHYQPITEYEKSITYCYCLY